MTKTTKIKNQKPIEIDASLKYRCPNKNCGLIHWLTLKETQVKNFKVVCECGTIFSPRVIKKLKIIFLNKKIKKTTPIVNEDAIQRNTVPKDLLDSCSQLLIDYGFTVDETLTLLNKAIEKNPSITSGSVLVKYILENLGDLK